MSGKPRAETAVSGKVQRVERLPGRNTSLAYVAADVGGLRILVLPVPSDAGVKADDIVTIGAKFW